MKLGASKRLQKKGRSCRITFVASALAVAVMVPQMPTIPAFAASTDTAYSAAVDRAETADVIDDMTDAGENAAALDSANTEYVAGNLTESGETAAALDSADTADVAGDMTEAGETAAAVDNTRKIHWNDDQTLTIGDTWNLSGTLLETDLAGRKVTWSSSNENVATVAADGTITAKGTGTVTITATAEDGTANTVSFTFHINPDPVNPLHPDQPDSPIPFTDVHKTDYFYDAVVWAYQNHITSGTSATTFSPYTAMTRAQMITFVWKQNGSPKVSGTLPFSDVPAGSYYHDAVLWAYTKGITSGTSATTFGPNKNCSRAQMITFLYKASGEKTEGTLPFIDVHTDDYWHDAVLWAYQNGITSGATGTLFRPGADCQRCQAIQFMYKVQEKK